MDCAIAPNSTSLSTIPSSPSTPHSPHLPKPTILRASSPVTPLPHITPHPIASCTPSEATTLRSLRLSALRRSTADANLLANIQRHNGTVYLNNRHVLVEWLVNVCRLLRIGQATLHAAVAHVDRCMAARPMSRKCWQLCAVAALLVAAKVEEAADSIPNVADLEYMCAGDFDADYIRRMEVCLLDLLNWDTLSHTPVHFLLFFRTVFTRCQRDRTALTRRTLIASPITPTPTTLSSQHDPTTAPGTPPSSHHRVVERRRRAKPVTEHTMTRRSQFCPVDREGDSPMRDPGSECVSDVEEEEDDDDLSTDADDHLSMFENLVNPSNASAGCDSDDVFVTAQCVLDLALYEPRLRATYSSPLLAAAAWAAARHLCQFSPVWTADMASITGLSDSEDMRACFHQLVQLFERAREEE